MSSIQEYVAEIGLDAGKEKIKNFIMEKEARKRLNKFLERQNKLNFNCTKEEEIDFEGLANYIRYELIDDVKLRLFGNRKTRGIAYKSIVEKVVYYAQSKTSISKQRATAMVSASLSILRKYYESKANREFSYFEGLIEDTIIDEMSDQHAQMSKQLEEVNERVESNLLLSLEHNMELASSGQIAKVGNKLSKYFKAIGSTHPLSPYYGYNMKNLDGEMVSIPLSEEAVIKYPPQFNITADNVYVGSKDISELHIKDVIDYSYCHQLPISFDVSTANKFLGNVLDPIQEEAVDMQGSKMIIMPPKFPKAFPCSISINGKTAFDYLLIRTKEILEDGTVVVTNEEQDNRAFDIVFSINQSNKKTNFNIRPLAASNAEQLRYCEFIKDASIGGAFAIKVLSLNVLLGSGNINPFIASETLNSEIEFLQKITTIEHYFSMDLVIPQEITIEDHQTLDHVYDIIHVGSFSGHWSTFKAVFEISEDFKEKINEMNDALYMFAYTCIANIELFDQAFSFPMKREIRAARFKDLIRLKEKAKILDIGDTITINLVPDEAGGNNIYIDTFATEDVK